MCVQRRYTEQVTEPRQLTRARVQCLVQTFRNNPCGVYASIQDDVCMHVCMHDGQGFVSLSLVMFIS